MRQSLKEAEHFIRAAILFAVGLVLFLSLRAVLVPKEFGKYGHFRPGALADNVARPISFAGRAACEECHGDVVEARQGSKHDRVNCEACHQALAAHAQDPASVSPQLPDAATLCLRCHERQVARPADFPQIDPREHAGDEACTTCHRPHHPEVE